MGLIQSSGSRLIKKKKAGLVLSSLIAWWDASDTATVTGSATNKAISDKSGNSNNLSYREGSIELVSNELNSKSILRFTDGMLQTNALINIDNYTVMCVAKNRTTGNGGVASQFIGGDAGRTVLVIERNGDRGGLNIASAYSVMAGSYQGGYHKYTYRKTGTALFSDYDGVTQGSDTSANNAPNTNFIVGGFIFGNYCTLDFAEMLVYNKALNSAEITSNYNYFTGKWGV